MRREGTVATQNKTETGLVAGVWLDLTIVNSGKSHSSPPPPDDGE